MTFDVGLHEVCVRVGALYVITKFSRMDSLPNFLTHGAPLHVRFARAGAPLKIKIRKHVLRRTSQTRCIGSVKHTMYVLWFKLDLWFEFFSYCLFKSHAC